jgi:hypothetical protein
LVRGVTMLSEILIFAGAKKQYTLSLHPTREFY